MEALEQTLRTVLTPVTHNLPTPLRDIGTELLGESCYRSLVHNLTISDSVCLKLAISKGLGIAIIGASSIVKIPQLLKLLNAQSAEGVSFLSYLLETVSFVVSLAYNVRNGFPFSTYGEVALIAIQNIVISVLVLHYSGKGPVAIAFLAGLAGAAYALLSESIVPMATLQYFTAGASVLGVASKLPQIATIFQQGGTGQLSAFAVFNYLAGSLSRIFTTLQEVDDKLILYGFVSGFILNAVLAAQMVYYWNSPPPSKKTPTKSGAAGSQKQSEDVPSVAHSTGSQKGKSPNKTKNTPSTRRRG